MKKAKPRDLHPNLRTLVLVDEANTSSSARPLGINLDWIRLRDFIIAERGRELIEMIFYVVGIKEPPYSPLLIYMVAGGSAVYWLKASCSGSGRTMWCATGR